METEWRLGETKVAQVGQHDLRYHEHGEGPTVVFVHGLLVNGQLWRKVVPRLDGFRCIVPELPLGSHEIPLSPRADPSPRGIARLLGEFLATLELSDVTLVGNDTGGALCQLLIAERSERVGRLVLTNCDAYERFLPPVFRYLEIAARSRVAVYMLAKSLRLPGVARLPIAQGWLAKRPIDREVVGWYVGPVQRRAAIRRDLAAFLRGVDARDTVAAARTFDAFERPVLLAWAEEDRVFPASYARRLLDDFPHARLEVVDDSYAYVPEDRPERLAELITEFIA